ncbi:MAG: glycosyltransferase family 9 protein [Elusimicrobia bacterium]|nr:glycosyltransferase family 9 protein [Candidatus Liberimonas magnetica]
MKILIIKPSSFGDIIHANPVIAALKKLYNDSHITWLVFDSFKDILALFPGLDNTIVWDRKGGIKEFARVVRLIRKEKFDLVIDLQGLFRTGLISFLSGAKEKIGVPGLKEFSNIFIREVYPENKNLNAIKRNLETVRYLSGQKINPEFNIKIPKEVKETGKNIIDNLKLGPGEKVIAMLPFSRGLSKIWPLAYYEELATLLLKEFEKTKIVILGNKSLPFKTSGERVMDLCGKTSIHELVVILGNSKVVIGGDTGPMQLAASLDIPVVMIFGGSDVNETSPVSKKLSILKKDYPCSPCRTSPICKDFPCLKDIKPEEVLGKIKKWI